MRCSVGACQGDLWIRKWPAISAKPWLAWAKLRSMPDDYDPNVELPPNLILGMAVVLVGLACATVYSIVFVL